MYTVSLELPDLCEAADFPGKEPTPLDAVEAFIAGMTGSPDHWTYRVRHDDGRQWIVDMASGPSVQED